MNDLTREKLSELVAHQDETCISLYMPSHSAGRERLQDPIRLKNLITEAEEKLVSRGRRRRDAETLLAPVDHLRREEPFWQRRVDGLAMFCAKDFFRWFRVPIAFDQRVEINERFFVKPLLPLLHSDGRFFILTLTQENAKLFQATHYSTAEICLPELERPEPEGRDENLHLHSHRAPSQGKGRSAETIFHGQGGPDDRQKADTLQFFHSVDRAVQNQLRGHRAPLVLACVGYLASLYQETNSYPKLLTAKVPGNPEMWSEEELRERAWRIVEPHFRQQQQQALDRFGRNRSGDRASADLGHLLLAATQGAVDTLLMRRDQELWGHIDTANQIVHLTDGNEGGADELLNFAAAHTLANNGDVFVVDELPEDAPAVATFRYPVSPSKHPLSQ